MNQQILDMECVDSSSLCICQRLFCHEQLGEKVTGIEKTILLPDGNLDYTEEQKVGQAVEKRNLGFGMRDNVLFNVGTTGNLSVRLKKKVKNITQNQILMK